MTTVTEQVIVAAFCMSGCPWRRFTQDGDERARIHNSGTGHAVKVVTTTTVTYPAASHG